MTAGKNQKFDSDRTFSNLCGVTLMNNQNGHVVAEVMRGKSGVSVEEYPSMIRVDGEGKLLFDFDEISEAIGFEFDQSDFEEIMSTHYGRMVHFDDKTMLFASPEEAAEYIDFDLKPVQ
ncbi:MmoB/DmpM family protein [Streptomyces sp. 110]|uniref:MmoB/DmpM family protein n=1 Tax=Streptomyces endocoffeicus TaxID=2898945 RepID=A0ABS1Q1W3_9ACTN|nr:MmoB/DmpM family protein [Streptomyces endocoffeicus]MBL1118643.1 MmoB/DmpM family protein [Streptomyces endocoffeicus]